MSDKLPPIVNHPNNRNGTTNTRRTEHHPLRRFNSNLNSTPLSMSDYTFDITQSEPVPNKVNLNHNTLEGADVKNLFQMIVEISDGILERTQNEELIDIYEAIQTCLNFRIQNTLSRDQRTRLNDIHSKVTDKLRNDCLLELRFSESSDLYNFTHKLFPSEHTQQHSQTASNSARLEYLLFDINRNVFESEKAAQISDLTQYYTQVKRELRNLFNTDYLSLPNEYHEQYLDYFLCTMIRLQSYLSNSMTGFFRSNQKKHNHVGKIAKKLETTDNEPPLINKASDLFRFISYRAYLRSIDHIAPSLNNNQKNNIKEKYYIAKRYLMYDNFPLIQSIETDNSSTNIFHPSYRGIYSDPIEQTKEFYSTLSIFFKSNSDLARSLDSNFPKNEKDLNILLSSLHSFSHWFSHSYSSGDPLDHSNRILMPCGHIISQNERDNCQTESKRNGLFHHVHFKCPCCEKSFTETQINETATHLNSRHFSKIATKILQESFTISLIDNVKEKPHIFYSTMAHLYQTAEDINTIFNFLNNSKTYAHGIALLKAVTKLRNSHSKHPMPWIQKFNKTFSTVISQSFSEHLRRLLNASESRHLTKFLTSLKPDLRFIFNHVIQDTDLKRDLFIRGANTDSFELDNLMSPNEAIQFFESLETMDCLSFKMNRSAKGLKWLILYQTRHFIRNIHTYNQLIKQSLSFYLKEFDSNVWIDLIVDTPSIQSNFINRYLDHGGLTHLLNRADNNFNHEFLSAVNKQGKLFNPLLSLLKDKEIPLNTEWTLQNSTFPMVFWLLIPSEINLICTTEQSHYDSLIQYILEHQTFSPKLWYKFIKEYKKILTETHLNKIKSSILNQLISTFPNNATPTIKSPEFSTVPFSFFDVHQWVELFEKTSLFSISNSNTVPWNPDEQEFDLLFNDSFNSNLPNAMLKLCHHFYESINTDKLRQLFTFFTNKKNKQRFPESTALILTITEKTLLPREDHSDFIGIQHYLNLFSTHQNQRDYTQLSTKFKQHVCECLDIKFAKKYCLINNRVAHQIATLLASSQESGITKEFFKWLFTEDGVELLKSETLMQTQETLIQQCLAAYPEILPKNTWSHFEHFSTQTIRALTEGYIYRQKNYKQHLDYELPSLPKELLDDKTLAQIIFDNPNIVDGTIVKHVLKDKNRFDIIFKSIFSSSFEVSQENYASILTKFCNDENHDSIATFRPFLIDFIQNGSLDIFTPSSTFFNDPQTLNSFSLITKEFFNKKNEDSQFDLPKFISSNLPNSFWTKFEEAYQLLHNCFSPDKIWQLGVLSQQKIIHKSRDGKWPCQNADQYLKTLTSDTEQQSKVADPFTQTIFKDQFTALIKKCETALDELNNPQLIEQLTDDLTAIIPPLTQLTSEKLKTSITNRLNTFRKSLSDRLRLQSHNRQLLQPLFKTFIEKDLGHLFLPNQKHILSQLLPNSDTISDSAAYLICKKSSLNWPLFKAIEQSPVFIKRFGAESLISHYVQSLSSANEKKELGKRIVKECPQFSGMYIRLLGFKYCPQDTTWASFIVQSTVTQTFNRLDEKNQLIEDIDLLTDCLRNNRDIIYGQPDNAQSSPLITCCQTLLTANTQPEETIKGMIRIIDNLMQKLLRCIGNQDTIETIIEDRDVELIQSIRQFIEGNTSDSTHKLIKSKFIDWKNSLDKREMIDSFSFVDTRLPAFNIDSQLLNSMIGTFNFSHTDNIHSHNIEKTILIFDKFLTFLSSEVKKDNSPINDLTIEKDTLPFIQSCLTNFNTLRQTLMNNRYRLLLSVIRRLHASDRSEDNAILSSAFISYPKFLDTIENGSTYRNRFTKQSMDRIVQDSTFFNQVTNETEASLDQDLDNFNHFLAKQNVSIESLLQQPDIHALIEKDPDFERYNTEYFNDLWSTFKSGESEFSISIFPTGYWKTNQSDQDNQCISILMRNQSFARLVVINPGDGNYYHSGMARTSEADDDDRTIITKHKEKRVPFLSIKLNLDKVNNDIPPPWLSLLVKLQFPHKKITFNAKHFYETILPLILKDHEIEPIESSDLPYLIKTPFEGFSTEFQVVKSLIYLNHIKPIWFQENSSQIDDIDQSNPTTLHPYTMSPYGYGQQATYQSYRPQNDGRNNVSSKRNRAHRASSSHSTQNTLLSKNQSFKNFLAVFYLWLGEHYNTFNLDSPQPSATSQAVIPQSPQQQPAPTQNHPISENDALLAYELRHKVATNIVKILDELSNDNRSLEGLNFLAAQAHKIGKALETSVITKHAPFPATIESNRMTEALDFSSIAKHVSYKFPLKNLESLTQHRHSYQSRHNLPNNNYLFSTSHTNYSLSTLYDDVLKFNTWKGKLYSSYLLFQTDERPILHIKSIEHFLLTYACELNYLQRSDCNLSDEQIEELGDTIRDLTSDYFEKTHTFINSPNYTEDPIQFSSRVITSFTLFELSFLLAEKHSIIGPIVSNYTIDITVPSSHKNSPHLSFTDVMNNLIITNGHQRHALIQLNNAYLSRNDRDLLFQNDFRIDYFRTYQDDSDNKHNRLITLKTKLLEENLDWNSQFNDHLTRKNIHDNAQKLRELCLDSPKPEHNIIPNINTILYSAKQLLLHLFYPKNLYHSQNYLNGTREPTLHWLSQQHSGQTFCHFWLLPLESQDNIRPNPSIQTFDDLATIENPLLFQANQQPENSLMAKKINTSMSNSDYLQLFFIGSENVNQRFERILSHIKDGVMDIENREHQLLLLQLLFQTIDFESNEESAAIFSIDHNLLFGFLQSFNIQFDLLKERTMTYSTISFLAKTITIFKQSFSDPYIKQDFSESANSCREWLLNQALQSNDIPLSLSIITSLIDSYQYQLPFNESDHDDILLFLSAISLHSKFINLAPDDNAKSISKNESIAFKETTIRHCTFLNKIIQRGSLYHLLDKAVQLRYSHPLTDGAWTFDDNHKVWTKNSIVFDIFTGDIFVDGFPLGCLPASCLNHPHYKDYLGTKRFEVFRQSDGAYVTANTELLSGEYRFYYNSDNTLPFHANASTINFNGDSYKKIDNPFSDQHFQNIKTINKVLTDLNKVIPSNSTFGYFYPTDSQNNHSYLITASHSYKFKLFFRAVITQDTQLILNHIYHFGNSVFEHCLYSTSPYELIWPYRESNKKNRIEVSSTNELKTELPTRSLEDRHDFLKIECKVTDSGEIRMAIPKFICASIPAFIYADRINKLQFWSRELDPQKNKEEIKFLGANVIDIYECEPDRLQDEKLYFRISIKERVIYKPNERICFYNLFQAPSPDQNFSAISSLLKFEDLNFIALECTETFHVGQLRLPRFGLNFSEKVSENRTEWVSHEFPGFFITEQPSINIWPRFNNYLMLKSNESSDSFRIVFPHFNLLTHKVNDSIGIHFDVSEVKDGTYSVFAYDPIMKRFTADSILGKLYLSILFYATASLEKCPYTELNGYEMSAEILKTCRQNKPYSSAEIELLYKHINWTNDHRNSIAIKLRCFALLNESVSILTFYPFEENLNYTTLSGKYNVNHLYSKYLKKEERIDAKCSLSLNDLHWVDEASKNYHLWQKKLLPDHQSSKISEELTSKTGIGYYIEPILAPSSKEIMQFDTQLTLPIVSQSFKFSTFSNQDVDIYPLLTSWHNIPGSIDKSFWNIIKMVHIDEEPPPKIEINLLIRYYFIKIQSPDKLTGNDSQISLLKILMIVNLKREAINFEIPTEIFTASTIRLNDSNLSGKELYHCFDEIKTITRDTKLKQINDLLDNECEKLNTPLFNGYYPRDGWAEEDTDRLTHRLLTVNFVSDDISENKKLVIKQALTKRLTTIRLNYLAASCLIKLIDFFNSNHSSTFDSSPSSGLDYTIPRHSKKPIASATLQEDQSYNLNPDKILAKLSDTLSKILDRQDLNNSEELKQKIREKLINDNTQQFVRITETPCNRSRFPLKIKPNITDSASHTAATKFYQRLETSWQSFSELQSESFKIHTGDEALTLTTDPTLFIQKIASNYDYWDAASKLIATWIEETANEIPESTEGWKISVARMKGFESLTRQDCISLLHDQTILDERNPFLRAGTIKDDLIDVVVMFAEIETHRNHLSECLKHLKEYAASFTHTRTPSLEQQLLYDKTAKMLNESRKYDAHNDHSKLLFELLNSIYIRENQLTVTELLVSKSKMLTQLLMGQGKSSVIVMLIIIALIKQKKSNGDSNLVRLIVPDSLITDMEHLIKQKLGTSFNVLVYLFPYHREIKQRLTFEQLKELERQLNDCKKNGHIVLMTPEQVLSLRLTVEELMIFCQSLDKSSNKYKYHKARLDCFKRVSTMIDKNIIDEADDVLAPNVELNYTMNEKSPLSGTPIRHHIAIKVIKEILTNPNIHELNDNLSNKNISIRSNSGRTEIIFQSDQSFKIIRGTLLEELLPKLFPKDEIRMNYEEIIKSETYLSNFSESTLTDEQMTALSLRCWFNSDVCNYIFNQRFRVNYGLLPISLKSDRYYKKFFTLKAVPYVGKDTPSYRSNFAHSDVEIGFTILSYFYNGLSEENIETVLKHLSTTIYDRSRIFKEWIDSSVIKTSIDEWKKLHIHDASHIENLSKVFKFNAEVIEYFLMHIVFSDTGVYEKKLTGDAATLSRPDSLIGFSGTMDIKDWLDPNITTNFSVSDVRKQRNLDAILATKIRNSMLATDGEIMHLIYDSRICQAVVKNNISSTDLLLESVVKRVSDNGHFIFMDRGALITGLNNREVAISIVKKFIQVNVSCKEDGIPNKIKYRGVVFYDDFTNLEMVAMVPKDRDDIIDIKPLSSTQVEEALLFRYLNDMRTRGTDIKLPLMTKGILTIGKDLCLSKLVQAAYRLRQLGKGQTLEFWLLDETFDSIRKFIETYGNRTNISDSSISSQDIYEWCASNSIKQAITFSKFNDHKQLKAMKKESLVFPKNHDSDELEDPQKVDYNQLMEPLSIPLDHYNKMRAADRHESQTQLAYEAQAETQTEMQVEQEAQSTLMFAETSPLIEYKWNYESIFTKPTWFSEVAAPITSTKFSRSSLLDVWKHLITTDSQLSDSEYSSLKNNALSKLHISSNFWRSVTENTYYSYSDNTKRLKPIDAYLEFIDEHYSLQTMIISGKEASEIKALIKNLPQEINVSYVYLRQISDPVGVTSIGYGDIKSLTQQQKDSQYHSYILMSIFNGDSGITHQVTDHFMGETEEDTAIKYNEYLSDIIKSFTPSVRLKFKDFIHQIQLHREKSMRYPRSPLENVIKSS